MSLLQRGVNLMLAKLLASEGETVTISGDSDSVSLTAIKAKGDLTVENADGVLMQFSDADFIIKASDLILNGAVTNPARGFKVTRADATVYEVLAPEGMQSFRYSDHNETMMRIHTKKR